MAQYVTVTYHSEYGVVPTETKIAANTVYTEADLPILTSEGREFVGWYTTSTFDEGTLLSVGDATVSNADYYAKWVVTVSSLLTNLADELRTLTNTTDKMGLSVMAGYVSDANTEVDEQSAVVDELMAALQGKSVPGGMYETCAVTFSWDSTSTIQAWYVGVENETLISQYAVNATGETSISVNVLKNTVVAVYFSSNTMSEVMSGGVTMAHDSTASFKPRLFYVSDDGSFSCVKD